MKLNNILLTIATVFVMINSLCAQEFIADTTIIVNNPNEVLIDDSTIFVRKDNEILVYEKNDINWYNKAVLTISNLLPDESINSLAVDEGILVIGAPKYSYSAGDQINGSTYIFEKTINGWVSVDTPTYTLRNQKYVNGPTFFGYSVDIQKDELIISAMEASTSNGVVYVYKKSNEEWLEIAELTGIGIEEYGQFGHDVSISGDYIFVGDNPISLSPSIYGFKRPLSNWSNANPDFSIISKNSPVTFGWSLDSNSEYLIAASPFSTEQNLYLFQPDESGNWNNYDEIVIKTDTPRYRASIGLDVKIWDEYIIYDNNDAVKVSKIDTVNNTVSEIFKSSVTIQNKAINDKYMVLAKKDSIKIFRIEKEINDVLSSTEKVSSGIKIYPNPVNNNLITIESDKIVDKISLTNLEGKSIPFHFVQNKVETYNIQPGIYLLNVSFLNNLTQTIRLVVE